MSSLLLCTLLLASALQDTPRGRAQALADEGRFAEAWDVLEDETVSCWGGNESGQLGSGRTGERGGLVPVVGLEAVVELSSGTTHNCARTREGRVWCWGDNNSGQLGFESEWKKWGTPQRAQVPEGAKSVVMGEDTACAISEVGKLTCWGDDIDLPVSTAFPLEWDDPSDDRRVEHIEDVVDISFDNGASCFVGGKGAVGCCDFFVGGMCRTLEGVRDATQVQVQSSMGCALTKAGEVYCWGDVTYKRGEAPARRVRKLSHVIELMRGPLLRGVSNLLA